MNIDRTHHQPTFVYIAGYGRSGSTVLDIILGSKEGFFSSGELTYLFEDFETPGRFCACGKNYLSCEVWGSLAAKISSTSRTMKDFANITRRVEKRRTVLEVFSGKQIQQSNLFRDEYARSIDMILSVLGTNTPKFVVDSSKNAADSMWRPLSLKKIAGYPVKAIHLKRSLHATLKSVTKISNWEAEGFRQVSRHRFIRGFIGWHVANHFASRLRFILGEDSYHFVSYENLLKNTEKVVREIGNFLGEDLSTIAKQAATAEEFRIGHNVGGNRIRMNSTIRFGVQS